jgi:SAM-dependent methyltransferase
VSVDPAARFSGRAADYARARPSYPAGVLDVLRDACGLGPGRTVADLGSGTGLFGELLLRSGADVIAVEPNAEMRAVAEQRLHGEPRFRSVAGRAEDTTLDDASVDLVTAAQAFHWFDLEATRRELLRIVRPSAAPSVALVWNDRDLDGTPFLRDYEALLVRRCPAYPALQGKASATDRFDALLGVGRWRRFTVPNEQHHDREGLVQRLLSSSYAPPADDPTYDELRALFDREATAGAGGERTVAMRYVTVAIVGTTIPG